MSTICLTTGTCVEQEEDVVGVMPSKDIASLLPLGDRILIEVGASSLARLL